jgi:autotransporter-associated beta strand protein
MKRRSGRHAFVILAAACWAAGGVGCWQPVARAQGGYSVLSWQDEFDGTSVDPTKWSFELGTGAQYGLVGWGNNELQYYTARTANASVADGMLSLTARREAYGGREFTSARLTTRGHFAQTGGRFEIRAALPLGQGLWPAFWMLPAANTYGGWAASGEIDILEARGQQPDRVVTTIHYGGSWPGNQSRGTTLTLPRGGSIADFHDYALEWDLAPTPELRWYIDDRLAWKTRDWWSAGGPYPAPFDAPFNLMLNLAVGGNFVGSPDGSTPFPATMRVDYVRAYQSAPADIVIDVPSGANRSQAQAGFARVLAAASLTKTGAGELVLDADNPYAGPTVVTAGVLRIATARGLVGSAVRADRGSTLALPPAFVSPAVTLAGGVLAADELTIAGDRIARVSVEDGAFDTAPRVTVGAGGVLSLAGTSRVSLGVASLEVAEGWGGGLVDLGAGGIRIAAGGITAAELRDDLHAGRAGGGWNGTSGITSSTARAAAGGSRTVGYVLAADGGVEVSFAAPGDTNLDGSVDVFDLVGINGSGTYGTGRPAVWQQGDFSYDGVTDIFDLVAVGGADVYGRGGYGAFSRGLSASPAVPEPGLALGLPALGGLLWALLRRRNLRRQRAFQSEGFSAVPRACHRPGIRL